MSFPLLIDYKVPAKQSAPALELLINIIAEDGEEHGKDNNIYKFVNQLEITGNEKGIPVIFTMGKDQHKPYGLAQGPDGSLYVSNDAKGTIYRIQYRK